MVNYCVAFGCTNREKKSNAHKNKKDFFIGKNKLVKSNISKISTKTSLKSTELLPD